MGELLATFIKWILCVVGWFVACCAPALFIVWFVVLIEHLTNNPNGLPTIIPSPVGLAVTLAIFGAFGMTVGFSANVGSQQLRKSMRRTAIFYTISALGLTLLGFSIAGTQLQTPIQECCASSNRLFIAWILLGSYVVSGVAGIIGITGGTFVLTMNIQHLWDSPTDATAQDTSSPKQDRRPRR